MKRSLYTLLLISAFAAMAVAASAQVAPGSEFRGANVRADTVKTREGVDGAIAKAERGGFNALFVNVWGATGAVYHTEDFVRQEGVPDFDLTGYMIEECHKRGIAFFAMFVNARTHPDVPWHDEDWLVMNAQLERHEERTDYTNPEVREHELAVMTEFVELYPHVDGIQFDYIRFDWRNNAAYNEGARRQFEEIYGIDPLDLEVNRDEFNLEDHQFYSHMWREWRAEQVTSLVREVSRRVKEISPGVQVLASVMGPKRWIYVSCQDWPKWVNEGIVDFVKPMYYNHDNEAYREMLEFWRSMGRSEDYWERIIPSAPGTLRSGWPEELQEDRDGAGTDAIVNKVELFREFGLRGINFFHIDGMPESAVRALREGPFATPVRRYDPPPRKTPTEYNRSIWVPVAAETESR